MRSARRDDMQEADDPSWIDPAEIKEAKDCTEAMAEVLKEFSLCCHLTAFSTAYDVLLALGDKGYDIVKRG